MSPFDDVALTTHWWETAGAAAKFVRLRTLAARGTGELSAPSDQGIALRRSSLRPPGSRTGHRGDECSRNAQRYHDCTLRSTENRLPRARRSSGLTQNTKKSGPHHCGPCTRSPSSLTGQPSASHRTRSRLTVAIGSLARDLELGVRPCSDGGRPIRISRHGCDQPHIGQEQVPPRQPRTRPGGTYSLGTNCCLVFSRRSASLLSTLNSTLRFFAMPSVVLLVAMGCLSP